MINLTLGFQVKMPSKSMKFKQGCVCDRGNIVGREKSKTRTNGYHREQTKPSLWLTGGLMTTIGCRDNANSKTEGSSIANESHAVLNVSSFRFLSHHICQWVFYSSRSKWRGSWDLLSWWKLSEPVEETVENFKKEQNWLSVCLTSGAREPAKQPMSEREGTRMQKQQRPPC